MPGTGTLAWELDLGSAVFEASPSQSSVAVTLLGAIPAGAMALVTVATSQCTTELGESNEHTLADNAALGHTWEKLTETTSPDDTGGSSEGCTLSLWRVIPEVEIPAGTIITATLPGAKLARGIACDLYDLGPDFDAPLLGVAANAGANFPSLTPRTVNLTLGDSGLYTWIGRGCWDQGGSAVPTGMAGWTTDRQPVLEGSGGRSFGVTFFGQMRAFESGSQTWTITQPGINARRWCMLLAAFAPGEAEPPDPPPVGELREYQRDFETIDHGVDNASTTRRPDAISQTYLTAYCRGPRGLGDPSSGPDYTTWRLRVDVRDVYLCRGNIPGNAWDVDQEILLFSYTGVVIEEVSVAFELSGAIVVAAERRTGAGASPQVWLYRGTTGGDFDMLIAGKTPRVLLDWMGGCAPPATVQLFYFKPNVGLMRRNSDDSFGAEYGTPVGWNRRYALESVFTTEDKRVGLCYSAHDEAAGTYELRREYSVSYEPTRPHFIPEIGNDNDWLFPQGMQRLNPMGSQITEDFFVQISVEEAVDAIELGFSTDGTIPFDEQEYEYAPPGGIPALGLHKFQFIMTHGDGAMSPQCARARTRTQLPDGRICYSKWRYSFMWGVSASVNVANSFGYTRINCDRDAMVCLPVIEGFQIPFNGQGVLQNREECDDPPVVPPAGCAIEGGVFGIGGWTPSWDVTFRTVGAVRFDDENELIETTFRGVIYDSAGEGAGGPGGHDPNMSPFEFP